MNARCLVFEFSCHNNSKDTILLSLAKANKYDDNNYLN